MDVSRRRVPRVAQGCLLRRLVGAEVAQLAVLARLYLAHTSTSIRVHALEPRLTARRQDELDPLGRRERPDFVRREWWLDLLLSSHRGV